MIAPNLTGDLASIAMALDGGEQIEPDAQEAMTFRPDCVMGKLELELTALRGALELCQVYAARMHKRI